MVEVRGFEPRSVTTSTKPQRHTVILVDVLGLVNIFLGPAPYSVPVAEMIPVGGSSRPFQTEPVFLGGVS